MEKNTEGKAVAAELAEETEEGKAAAEEIANEEELLKDRTEGAGVEREVEKEARRTKKKSEFDFPVSDKSPAENICCFVRRRKRR